MGHALPLCLTGTSLTFETRVMCHSSGEPLLLPCPPPCLSCPVLCPQALGTLRLGTRTGLCVTLLSRRWAVEGALGLGSVPGMQPAFKSPSEEGGAGEI